MRAETVKLFNYDAGNPENGRKCPEAVADDFNPIVYDNRCIATVRSITLSLPVPGPYLSVSVVTLQPELLALFAEPIRSAVWPDYRNKLLFAEVVSDKWGTHTREVLAPEAPFNSNGVSFIPRLVSTNFRANTGERWATSWDYTPASGVAMRRDTHRRFFDLVRDRLAEYLWAYQELPREIGVRLGITPWGEGTPTVEIVRDPDAIRAMALREATVRTGRNLLY